MTARLPRGLAAKRPVVHFIAVFAAMVLGINVLLLARVQDTPIILGILRINAHLAGGVLDLFGESTTVTDRVVAGNRYTLEVSHGCDAVQPIALFIAAVVATPAAWRRRLLGVVAGACLLFALNFVRIITLYYVGAYDEKYFDVVHVEVWGAAFILLAMVLWLLWASWAMRSASPAGSGATSHESNGC